VRPAGIRSAPARPAGGRASCQIQRRGATGSSMAAAPGQPALQLGIGPRRARLREWRWQQLLRSVGLAESPKVIARMPRAWRRAGSSQAAGPKQEAKTVQSPCRRAQFTTRFLSAQSATKQRPPAVVQHPIQCSGRRKQTKMLDRSRSTLCLQRSGIDSTPIEPTLLMEYQRP